MATSKPWRPWSLGADGTVIQNTDAPPVLEAGNWLAAERLLGICLPSDYKALIGDGGAWCLDGELYITSPFDRSGRGLNLFQHICVGTWAAAFLRASGTWELDYPVYPEPGGLLPWGSDQNGGIYYWDTAAGDADRWITVVDGRGVEAGPVPVGLAAYLEGLVQRTILPVSYDPQDWPTAGNLERVTASES